MNTVLKVLMLEDDAEDAEIIQRLITKEKINCEFFVAMDRKNYMKALEEFSPELILSDHSIPQFNSSDALSFAREKIPGIPFIMVTGAASEEFAAKIIKQGADDYILKDRMTRLPAAIKAAMIQRKSQKELNDYKYALDESSIVAITDQKGIIIHANENYCKISKYSLLELIGQHHRICSSNFHSFKFIRGLVLSISNGKSWSGEFCNKAKDGSIFWVDAYIVPFLNLLNKPYQYLAISQDITQRKIAEEALKKSELRLNEAQAVAHIANWEVDIANNTHTWSDELYNILGLNKEEVIPSTELFLSFVDDENTGEAANFLKEELKERRNAKIDFRFKLRNGKKRYGHIEWRFEFDSTNNPCRIFGILQDITERKVAEENVMLLEKKVLNQKIMEQKKIALAVLKGQELERNFIGQELHDNVNQILASSKMYLKSACKKDENVNELIKYPIELIELSIKEIKQLSHRLVLPLKGITLKEMVEDCLYTISANTNIKTSLSYNIGESIISNDLQLNIYRIIQELLNNANKYADAKNIEIVMMANAGTISIIVTDDGIGYNTKIKRLGIGINNITYRVKCFGGKVSIISSEGNGCITNIKIPY